MNLLKIIHLKIVCFFALSVFFTSCHNSGKEKGSVDCNAEIEKKYIGKWFSVERLIPYSAVLKVDPDHSFTFEGGACLSSFDSKGSWILHEDTLILTGLEPTECCLISNFGIDCNRIDLSDPDSVKIKSPEISMEDCVPDDRTYSYIVFKQEKFLIRDDTLTHIPKIEIICTDVKDIFTRNRRK